ncbi:IPTL-CTERM sorting domain-containing protein [Comamonas odontotermitis]|uniref:IPTL-CTERM sorting domain-containing protein n=1 Tax=Comamonas odontotermitis TaxID=379895 RepID=UPI001CC40DA6|nr:IPTL-CTERM sorting domain-containing protein [Comamonas odontotermitis]UBB15767.1 IPTL-CTERM sorting domain-containing protein [Comamonas odontotermitis]
MQSCTPTQVRATERYWFAGNKIAMDFGVSGTALPTITASPATVSNVQEGSTVVTDANGTLQFWVGEGSVYNRNQVVMANGSGITGNLSAVQVVVAFAAPDVPGKYFVVATSGAAAGIPGTLLYSIVDMTANGGLGAVTSKNITVPGGISSNETLSAVPNSDGTGYWVLTTSYGTRNLVAQLFDSNGPVGAPVVSTLSEDVGNLFGSIYFNKDLTQFAVATSVQGSNSSNIVRTMRFNAQTGQATEIASWHAGTTGSAYAADFSPSGKYLYVSNIYPGQLYRYDVSSGDAATIKASEESVGVTGDIRGGGHVRRGPDGAMWIAHEANNPSLTRIANPDEALVANIGFARGNIALPAGVTSRWGLPQTVAGCPKPLAPDAVPAVSGPAAPFYVGTPQTLAVNLANQGGSGNVADGTLTINLPANVQAGSGLPAACTAVSPQQINCDLAAAGMGPVAPGANLGPLSIPVTVSAPGTYNVDVTVAGVTGETGAALLNNTAQTSITALALAPDAVPAISGPAAPFGVGTPQVLAVQVANNGAAGDVTDGTLTVTLPANVQVTGGASLPAGCTATTPQQIACNLALAGGPVAPGASLGPLNIPVTVSAPGTYSVDAVVTGVTGEVDAALLNNTAQTSITAQGSVPPVNGAAPVPTLGAGALAALSVALGALAIATRRRKAQVADRR